jgi:hypothetical protein
MKVRLAVQVFSQSTADALSTLQTMSDAYPEFKDVSGTVKFLKVCIVSVFFYTHSLYLTVWKLARQNPFYIGREKMSELLTWDHGSFSINSLAEV